MCLRNNPSIDWSRVDAMNQCKVETAENAEQATENAKLLERGTAMQNMLDVCEYYLQQAEDEHLDQMLTG